MGELFVFKFKECYTNLAATARTHFKEVAEVTDHFEDGHTQVVIREKKWALGFAIVAIDMDCEFEMERNI